MSQLLHSMIVGICLAFAASSTSAQSWPSKPIRMVVPYSTGGPTDVVARAVGQQLTLKLGQSFFIDNRAGAAGVIGTEFVAKSAPDGYTLLMGSSASHAIAPVANKVNFDPIKDFDAISPVVGYIQLLVVNADSPFKTVQDLITFARSNPEKVSYGSTGNGGGNHLLGEWLASATNTKMVHVPYKGVGPSLIDLMAGRITFVFTALTPEINSPRLRAIATSGKTRHKDFPALPTVSETLPGIDSVGWFGLLAPAGTSIDIRIRIARELPAIMASTEVQRILTGGLDAFTTSPDEFAQIIKREYGTWIEVATKAGMKIQ